MAEGDEQYDEFWPIEVAGELYSKFCEMCPCGKPSNEDFRMLIWSMILKSDQDLDEQLGMLKEFVEMVELAKRTT